jgi:endonuclease/exonuclease/phosphatase family metal-dependent hydrolase
MKIVTWNCGGAFRKKFQKIKLLDPDVWIIQECENPKYVSKIYADYHIGCKNYLWTGDNKNKGLGIFCRPEIKLSAIKLDDNYRNQTLKWFIAAQIDDDLKILGVWNHHNNSKAFQYIGQFWLLLQNNKDELSDFIIAGDFNSNSIWDGWDRWWNHSDCVRELSNMGIESVYHALNKIEQGKELDKTFFLHRNLNKPYHIDYIFSPLAFLKNSQFKIGTYHDWIIESDHMPVTWNFYVNGRDCVISTV